MDDEVTLTEVDEAINNLRATLAVAIRANDSRAIERHRASIDKLLDARTVLVRDLAVAVVSCAPVFSG